MDNCKFLKQKKQVNINGEWVDTRSYRYLPYCDGGTSYVIIKGGESNKTIYIHTEKYGDGNTTAHKVTLDADGNGYQYVRKTSTTTITITPISAWSDIVPDKALNAIDQRLLETQKQIKALEELNDISATTKADNITLDSETNTITLTANGEKIGDAISISELGNSIADNTEDGLIKMVVI